MPADDGQSAATRPLAIRRRPDLIVFPQRFRGRTYLGIKDPLSLRYYHLREEEFFILQQLDGRTSAAAVQAAVEREFPPRRISYGQLHSFIAQLHREGLVVADAPGQGEQLLERRRAARRRAVVASLANVLALRFRGVNPEPLFAWLHARVRWVFSPWTLAVIVGLVAAAVLLLVVQYDLLQSRLPSFTAFFRLENLLWFALALAVSKILHEFGHGLTCKHFGGQCHELGVMFLAFTPCLYVNVSDAWTFPNKWQRVAVSAAGMTVELALAALCTFAWWFSAPGLLNSLCLRLMFVCSISTVVFNGNPLLRYDGYFILSDVLEIPNLRQQSTALVRRYAARWLLGIETADDRMVADRHHAFLIGYAVASVAYRLAVIAAILWFCHAVLKPYGLQALAQLLTVLVVAGVVLPPLWRAVRFLSVFGRSRQVKRARGLTLLAGIGLLVVAVLAAPLPHRITVPAVLQPQDARRVFVSVPGSLVSAVEAGTAVRQGEPLAELENRDLDLEIIRLRGQREILQAQLDSLRRRSAQQAPRGVRDAASQIPTTEEALADVQQRWHRRLEEKQRLTLKAPATGVVLPPPRHPARQGAEELETWSGQPLEPLNRHAYLEAGTLLCLIGDPHSLEALLVVDQAEIEFVEAGQRVRIRLDQRPGKDLEGRITEVSRLDIESAPPELIATGRLPIRALSGGREALVGVFYRVKVTLNDTGFELLPGAAGRARVDVGSLSLGRRLLRYLNSTFRFAMP
jgi:putative peptide zinc metalloprotease protein